MKNMKMILNTTKEKEIEQEDLVKPDHVFRSYQEMINDIFFTTVVDKMATAEPEGEQ